MVAPATQHKIIFTKTDESPAMALEALISVARPFLETHGIEIGTRDISLAGRIKANFPEHLREDQRTPDALAELGEMAKTPDANIIKLPNISADIPQLKAAIAELQEQGYEVPDYPEDPQTAEDRAIKATYDKIKGSAVNPVLREGNSDRRLAKAVKAYFQANPHKRMKQWLEQGSKCRVAHLDPKDSFKGSEKSVVNKAASNVNIVFKDQRGNSEVLKKDVVLREGEIVDTAVMNVAALQEFFEKELEQCLEDQVLFSLHMKATMMKESDPRIFGHCVAVFFKDVVAKHKSIFDRLRVNFNNGFGDLLSKMERADDSLLSDLEKKEIEQDIKAAFDSRPDLAMVDSDNGITNLHVPSKVIIDASMPNVVRDGGKMYGPDGKLHDAVTVIPDPSYAGIYQVVIEDCQENGQFDPATMGSVANIGLMAQKAQEYGSHDKTFEADAAGTICVIDKDGNEIEHLQQTVEKGDIFRMCQTKDDPIRDWVNLAVKRAKVEGVPAIFWLDEDRGHDAELIKKVKEYLPDDYDKLGIEILKPEEAMKETLKLVRKGKNVISVTGNVLRDYLTDLFPILEVGTSAKMLSIVPLMNGGGLFETGAGGSAPNQFTDMIETDHLRWDSLGEYLALAVSLEKYAEQTGNQKAQVFADALNAACGEYMMQEKAPSRKPGELDNRGATFYLALYWAKALSEQAGNRELKDSFSKIYAQLRDNAEKIATELTQGKIKLDEKLDIGGYYHPDPRKVQAIMNPSQTLNDIVKVWKDEENQAA